MGPNRIPRLWPLITCPVGTLPRPEEAKQQRCDKHNGVCAVLFCCWLMAWMGYHCCWWLSRLHARVCALSLKELRYLGHSSSNIF